MTEAIQQKKIKNQRHQKKKREVFQKVTHQLIQIKRVSKVVKGGKKLSFRAVVVVGITGVRGSVGIGIGKADDVTNAINKAISKGKKNLITIPITKNDTITHFVKGVYGACNVIIKPSAPGSGVIAGSSTRIILEVAGIRNILAKQIGSNNLLNTARATLEGLKQLQTITQVAKNRDVIVDSLYR
jgi:small subunit ribosomal protein S5